MWISRKFTCRPSLFSLPSHPHPASWGHHKGLSWAPCAIQRLPTSYLFYMWWSVYEKTNKPDTCERFVGKFSVIIQSTHIQCFSSVQFSRSVGSNSCNPMDCSTPGFPVRHQLPELSQTRVHHIGDAIQPSHPLSTPCLPAFNLSQHQGLFQWVSSSHQVAKVLAFQLQHQSFQRIFRVDFL